MKLHTDSQESVGPGDLCGSPDIDSALEDRELSMWCSETTPWSRPSKISRKGNKMCVYLELNGTLVITMSREKNYSQRRINTNVKCIRKAGIFVLYTGFYTPWKIISFS